MMTRELIQRLKTAEIILFILLALSTLVIILNYSILPTFGINVMASTSGDSMHPTIQEGAFIIWYDSSRVPFEDVKAGDIIIFRERDNNLLGSKSSTINFRKGGTSSTALAADKSPTDAPVAKEQTVPDPSYVADNLVMHRAVEVVEDPDRAIITTGDGNGYNDQLPVIESGYVGTVVWHQNYIGWPYRVLTLYKGFVWLIGAAVILGVTILILSRRNEE